MRSRTVVVLFTPKLLAQCLPQGRCLTPTWMDGGTGWGEGWMYIIIFSSSESSGPPSWIAKGTEVETLSLGLIPSLNPFSCVSKQICPSGSHLLIFKQIDVL